MSYILEKKSKVLDYYLELFSIQGNVFSEYSNVTKGYMFHFSLKDSNDLLDNFVFSLSNHWKCEMRGSLDELKIKLEEFKDKLLNVNTDKYKDIDQFAYINLFIIFQNNEHKLVISSDTFDVSKLIKIN